MDTVDVLGQAYRPRLIDPVLQRALDAAGAVLIEGARATGKTMTALHAAGSYAFVDDVDTRRLLEIAPRALLDGDAPRLLDEWQVAPQLWNMVRRAVDASPVPGRFILTGSAVPVDDVTRHTGGGRFLRLRQRTMAWYEKLGPARDTVSLAELFAGAHPATRLEQASSLPDVVENLLQPGFPAMSGLTLTQSAQRLRAYVGDVARTDIRRIADVRRAPEVITRLIAAVARGVASPISFTTLAADVRAVAPTFTQQTASAYVELLQRLFVVEAQPSWAPRLRSRARLRTSPKLHLVDPALAAAMLHAGPEHLTRDLETLGLLFESAAVHDLTAIAATMDGDVLHYRDSNGKEIDAVVTLPDGRWAAIEVKLGGGQIQKGAASLAAALTDIDEEPAFRLVLTGTGPTLVMDDGTVTVPLRALVP